MTVESPTNKSGPFIASGATGVFPRNFLVFDPAHVRVVRSRDGVETDIATGISHSGMGSASGTVTLTQGIQPGDRITILRNVPNVQRSDYSAQSSVPTDQVELDFDLIAMQVQDLAERQRRALTLPVDTRLNGEEAMRAALNAPQYAALAQDAAERAVAAAAMTVSPEMFGARAGDPSFDSAPAFAAAFAAGEIMHLRGGAVYYLYSGVPVPRRAQILGPGASNADTPLRAGAPKLIFRGNNPTQACFYPVEGTGQMFNHAKFQGFSMICEGNYSWMFDFGRCVQVSWIDVSASAVGLTTGGIRGKKANPADSAWLNQIDRCNIILPNGSTSRPLDQDWTDSVIQASSLSGGLGCLEQSHGNKWMMNNIERSSGAGVRLRKVTQNAASLFVGNLFDANATSGVTIDVSADETSGRTLGHIFIGNKFRTVSPVNGAPGDCDIAFQNPGTETYGGGVVVLGNHHAVASVPRLGGALDKFAGLVSGLDSHIGGDASFALDADPRTYVGRRGLNIPNGIAMIRGSQIVFGMDNVSGFFGADSGLGSGVQVGAVGGANPFLGASRDREGTATDLRIYTDNSERIRVDRAGAWMRPGADNVASLGTAANRWSQVYAGTGTINTSDGREKQDVRAIEAAEARVASRLRGLLRAYRMRDAVEEKGDGARIHFGIVAQDVAGAFESEGLDPSDYAMFCRDEWPEQLETLGETGEIVEPYRPAGERYGVRYDELICFILSASEI